MSTTESASSSTNPNSQLFYRLNNYISGIFLGSLTGGALGMASGYSTLAHNIEGTGYPRLIENIIPAKLSWPVKGLFSWASYNKICTAAPFDVMDLTARACVTVSANVGGNMWTGIAVGIATGLLGAMAMNKIRTNQVL